MTAFSLSSSAKAHYNFCAKQRDPLVLLYPAQSSWLGIIPRGSSSHCAVAAASSKNWLLHKLLHIKDLRISILLQLLMLSPEAHSFLMISSLGYLFFWNTLLLLLLSIWGHLKRFTRHNNLWYHDRRAIWALTDDNTTSQPFVEKKPLISCTLAKKMRYENIYLVAIFPLPR